MMYNFNSVRKQVLGLPLSEANFKVRGFEEGAPAQERLELVAKTVVSGYNHAVEHGLNDDLRTIISLIDKELQGFFHEGVAMGLYALDLFSPFNKNRLWKFIEEIDKRHEYMSYIGAGLAAGVFKRPYNKFLDKACPMSGCLFLDGIGFYYAMFKTKKTLNDFFVPKSIKKEPFYQERYDNGIGRAVWFVNSGEPEKIAKTIANFPEERQGGIWSGIGLAATYAGGVSKDKINVLKELSGKHHLMLAQGSVLAAHTRHTAGNAHQDDSTVQVLVGKSALDAHLFALKMKNELEAKRFIDSKPSFQIFLERLRDWIANGDHIPLLKTTLKSNTKNTV